MLATTGTGELSSQSPFFSIGKSPWRRLDLICICTLVVSLLSPASVLAAQIESHVLVGAGDIASCDSDRAEATAKLLDKIPGTVFTAGDNAYSRGTAQE